MSRRHWLIKSEPGVFSFDDLMQAPGRQTVWDGVRNFQARNFLRDDMKPGDRVLFYHSNADPPHVAGICEVARGGYPDPSAFDPGSRYFDPDSRREAPRWFVVEVRALERLPAPVTLAALKGNPSLAGMAVVARGQRLSVQPVLEAEYREVLAMAGLSDFTGA